MIRRRLLPLLIATVLLNVCAAAGAQGVSNPLYSAWFKFKPGAMARYTGISRTLGIETSIETTMKLLESASDKVTIEVVRKVTTANDTVEESPTREEIKATVPQDQALVPGGEEEIIIGDKNFKCRVYQQQKKHGEMLLISRYWLNDEVPGGIVRIDSKTEGMIAISTFIELKDFKP